MTRPILCATDFSDSAIRMSDSAAGIAAKLNVPLVLAHVHQIVHAAEESLSSSLRMAARARLHAEATRLRTTGLIVEERLLDGPPHEAILGLCEKLDVRLIVMAAREDQERSARWSFGGFVKNVITGAKVASLVVRDPLAIEDWLAGNAPQRLFEEFVSVDILQKASHGNRRELPSPRSDPL